MSVTVKTTNSNRVSVVQGSQTSASVVIKRADNLTIQGLSNVQSTDLQDGYTLVFDAATNNWVTQQITGDVISTVDGGTY
jgi:hypothetical protein